MDKIQQILEGRNDDARNFSNTSPERGVGSKADAATIAHEHGWEMLTINLDGTLSPPTVPVTCNLFQAIYGYGINQAAGAVLFPDPTNSAFGIVATAVTSTFQAIRNQFLNRSGKVNLARLNFTDPNQVGRLFQWITQDTYGYGMYYTWNLAAYKDPWQYQNGIIDVPVHPGKRGFEHRGLIRDDSGFNVVVAPNQSLNITFFFSDWNSSSVGLEKGQHTNMNTPLHK